MHLSLILLTSSWQQSIIAFDKYLFFLINMRLTNSFLDGMLPWYRDANTWLPLYLFLILFATINFKMRGLYWIIFFIACASITDQVSSHLLKDFFARLRPCADPDMYGYSRLLLSRCPATYSFTSSHATNHFGAAMFIHLTLKPYFKRYTHLFFIWAFTICYSQVYVGVHYPLDVFFGAILGCFIGWVMGNMSNKYAALEVVIVK